MVRGRVRRAGAGTPRRRLAAPGRRRSRRSSRGRRGRDHARRGVRSSQSVRRGDRHRCRQRRRSSPCRRGEACSPGPGSSTQTARRGTSATTAQRRGRRSAASSSPRVRNGLVALEPNGDVRWTIARPDVRFPRWGGGWTDTRIAYLSGSTLRIVAGDGTGDRAVGPAAPVAPAWREAAAARCARARLRGQARAHPRFAPRRDARSSGRHPGRCLALLDLVGRRQPAPRARPYGSCGCTTCTAGWSPTIRGRFVDAAFLPRSRTRRADPESSKRLSVVSLLGERRPLFPSTGRLRQVVPSPDGRWLLVDLAGRRRMAVRPAPEAPRACARSGTSRSSSAAARPSKAGAEGPRATDGRIPSVSRRRRSRNAPRRTLVRRRPRPRRAPAALADGFAGYALQTGTGVVSANGKVRYVAVGTWQTATTSTSVESISTATARSSAA